MKQLMANMLVPLIFLLSSFVVYWLITDSLSSTIESAPRMISQIEQGIAENPELAAKCGFGYQLMAEKDLLQSNMKLLSALKSFLVEGAIGLFLVSLAWQLYVHTKLRKYS